LPPSPDQRAGNEAILDGFVATVQDYAQGVRGLGQKYGLSSLAVAVPRNAWIILQAGSIVS
jgi:hypothetical protein